MCGGGEGSLMECNHDGIGKGTCNEYAEVICAGMNCVMWLSCDCHVIDYNYLVAYRTIQ